VSATKVLQAQPCNEMQAEEECRGEYRGAGNEETSAVLIVTLFCGHKLLKLFFLFFA
jgi:hypothetical protein